MARKLRWGVIGASGIADRRTIPGMMLAADYGKHILIEKPLAMTGLAKKWLLLRFNKLSAPTQMGGGAFMVETNGLAFLRKSHAGCDSPPDCRQEPAFESIVKSKKRDTQKGVSLFGGD